MSYKNEAYFEYFSHEQSAFREKVRFYEENQDKFFLLDPVEKLEMDMDYCLSLFEIGRYQRFLQKVDPVIEDVIYENVFEYMSSRIYEELLFKKAACYYNMQDLKKAESLLIQLMRIDPNHPGAASLLALCKRKSDRDIFVMFKALAVVSLFIAISITIARIILIEPFYDQYLLPFMWLRNGLIVLAILFWVSQECLINYEIFRETGRFASVILNRLYEKLTWRKGS